ncbi:MAG: MFS transporter [Pseudomonadota bacterium]
MVSNTQLSPTEWRAIFSLALLFFLRMLGLFMLLPVLSLYVSELTHATPTRIGLAIGIYALTQAIFQIPLGKLSDRFGRKPVIAGALAIFTIGSLVAALTNNVFFVILGRALQGAGALSSAALALAADLSRDHQRTKFMAGIGIAVALAFSIAFVAGPLIDGLVGLQGIFIFVACLGLFGILVLFTLVPTPRGNSETSKRPTNSRLEPQSPLRYLLLHAGGFFLHAILAITFVAVPLHLANELQLDSGLHFKIYLPVILLSLFFVGPMIMLSNRHRNESTMRLVAIAALSLGLGLLYFTGATMTTTGLALTIFFVGFNFLEAALPSQLSKETSVDTRGAAMGRYASLQFLGTFCGALLGGATLGYLGIEAVLGVAALLACSWFVTSVALSRPAPFGEQTLSKTD